MKTLSWWAIVSGIVIAAASFFVLPYSRWTTTRLLREFGAEELLPDAMQIMEEEHRVALLVTRMHSCLSLLAGILMLKRKRVGWILWAILCSFVIGASIFDIVRGAPATLPVLRGLAWACILAVSWSTVRKKAEPYWFVGTPRTAE